MNVFLIADDCCIVGTEIKIYCQSSRHFKIAG